MSISTTVRMATGSDLAYVVEQQRRWSNALGFLPRVAHTRYIDANRVLIAMHNGQRAGYANMIISAKGLLRLPQIAIDHELLRIGIGSALMHALINIGNSHGSDAIRLTSRADLHANDFWPTTGFYVTLTTRPNNARQQPLLEWTRQLARPSQRSIKSDKRSL